MIPTFLFTALFIQSAEIAYGKLSPLGRYIESSNWKERKFAYQYSLNSVIGIKRQKMKPYLVHLVKRGSPPRYAPIIGEEFEFSSRRVALSILAEWQDPSLIPLFLEFIVYQAPDPKRPIETDAKGRQHSEDYFAAVKGLIDIGQPALEPTLRELIKSVIPTKFNANGDSYKTASVYVRYKNLIYVFWCILDYQGTKDYFTREIEKLDKTNPKSADKLREALKFLEKNYHHKRNKP
ncbi:MAG: hypothetical protein JNJ77_04335 [Planctomycetia bacterium]|nr:hypothetical protein [Planctomycetia bacterium]